MPHTDSDKRSPSGRYAEQVAGFLSDRERDLPEILRHLEQSGRTLSRMAEILVRALRQGNKVLVAGNGGSAAEAQHFSAELVGRFKRDRRPYPAIALNTDTSILTALANDYSYKDVFARQIEALGQAGDLFVAYSTSGESENLVQAAVSARDRRMIVLAFTGSRANRLADSADLGLQVPSFDTPIVQEVHLMVTHLLCGIVEEELARDETEGRDNTQTGVDENGNTQ